jgi:hypothetical protein
MRFLTRRIRIIGARHQITSSRSRPDSKALLNHCSIDAEDLLTISPPDSPAGNLQLAAPAADHDFVKLDLVFFDILMANK